MSELGELGLFVFVNHSILEIFGTNVTRVHLAIWLEGL